MLGLRIPGSKNCNYGPCYECTDSYDGTVQKCLQLTVSGIISAGYYSGSGCCDRLNGTFKLTQYEHQEGGSGWQWTDGITGPGSACIWYGRLPTVPCDQSCPAKWVSIVVYTGPMSGCLQTAPPGGNVCAAMLMFTDVEPGRAITPTWQAWTWIALATGPASAPATCGELAICAAIAAGLQSRLVGCDPNAFGGPFGVGGWTFLDRRPAGSPGPWSCVWDLGAQTTYIALKFGECCCEDTYRPCCCWGDSEQDEIRTVYATVAGVKQGSGEYSGYYGCDCNCHNGWTWKLPLLMSEGNCGAAAVVDCYPCTQQNGHDVSLSLRRDFHTVSFYLGPILFQADWDGRCASVHGMVLGYVSGGDACDYSGATITLATSSQSGGPPSGPFCPNCKECPRPFHMYTTFSGMASAVFVDGTTTVTLDLAWLNGAWPLIAGGSNATWYDGCVLWELDLDALDGQSLGTVLYGGATYPITMRTLRTDVNIGYNSLSVRFSSDGTNSYVDLSIILHGVWYLAGNALSVDFGFTNRIQIENDPPDANTVTIRCASQFLDRDWESGCSFLGLPCYSCAIEYSLASGTTIRNDSLAGHYTVEGGD